VSHLSGEKAPLTDAVPSEAGERRTVERDGSRTLPTDKASRRISLFDKLTAHGGEFARESAKAGVHIRETARRERASVELREKVRGLFWIQHGSGSLSLLREGGRERRGFVVAFENLSGVESVSGRDVPRRRLD
jgi:hypothetical protein